jgi:hypothetical protein
MRHVHSLALIERGDLLHPDLDLVLSIGELFGSAYNVQVT